jgi:uncharacterized protein (DUF433 family)
MARDYIERRDDTFYIVGSRVPLEVVIHEYKNGVPAENIAHCFPTLSLEQIHGALAFYHANKAEVEREMGNSVKKWEDFETEHPIPAALKARLKNARQELGEARLILAMVRFLADACLNHYIVTACQRREPAIDFLSAVEADLEGLPDPAVLAFAAAEDRILVTHDVHTMPRHFGDFLLSGSRSPGVFLVKQRIPVVDVAGRTSF